MSNGQNPITPVTSSPAPSAPSGSDPTTASGAVSSNAPSSYTAATTVNSMSELKTKAPKLYDAMMLGIATSIVRRMQRQTDHLKKIIRDGQRR